MRIETDTIGQLEISGESLYGIHSLRSLKNFPSSGERIHPLLIKGYLQVKLAAAEANFKCGILTKEKYSIIIEAINELIMETDSFLCGKENDLYSKIIVDPYQGGAGTSLNMNINEVIANVSLKRNGKKFGEYSFIHPLDDVNMSQSTNDTFPTAFRIAALFILKELQDSYAVLQNFLQQKETEFKNVIKIGRTQLQDAVPVTLGQEFGAYAQSFARDRWRLYNAEERLRSVNLGGTAIGNSIAAQRDYVLNVNIILKKITKLPIAKAEDLIDATQNLDVFVEVHGIVKAGATTVIKMCNDLRFMASGPVGGIGEINLPQMQAGSSIMPGKINPVILENSIQISELVKGNDVIISNLVSAGNLELNAFMPMIAHLFLKSLTMLKDANINLAEKCISGITANKEHCKKTLMNSTAIAASLINKYGYEKIEFIVKNAETNKNTFLAELLNSKLVDETELVNIISQDLGIKIE
ncbi:MAG: aspartate ammonia-lyase [Ignavibacteria bacterium]|nr:MAG: aspartate ammonia-lyase [Ignavibacteria bacterium]KAF0162451.1 MAG: aspartate ammonia-lyase [Ignavibacteria bacterium]